MKRILLAAICILTGLNVSAQALILDKGKFKGGIYAPGTDSCTVQARDILREWLGKAAGQVPGIKTKAVKGSIVLREVGSALPEDSYSLLTENGSLVIAGNGKGLVYGVVEFLKKYPGIDYWGEGEAFVPRCTKLSLPALDTVVVPTFSYRQSQNYVMRTDPFYKIWYHLETPSEQFVADYWVHTCDRLLPADIYGEAHPEYYAWYGGRRNPGSASQWCFSNPEVLEIVCMRLDSLFKAHPDRNMISISQNDGSDTWCRCPECSSIMEEEGCPMGPVLRFINEVAARFPDKTISTLSYLFTVQPPRKTVPRENVSIMLCDIDCRRQTSLPENPSGQVFMSALEVWSKRCDKLFVWDYGINFDNYLSPFPNLSTIKDNMVIFRDHNVKMHFSQISSERGGDIAELRSYVVNNLMWDASASLDSLEHRFLTRYYGAAGFSIYKYIKLMEGAAVGTDMDLFIYDSPVSYKNNILRPELRRRYNALFDEAEAAVEEDSLLLSRVRRTRLSLQYSELELARADRNVRISLPGRKGQSRDYETISAALDLFSERTGLFGVETLNERHNPPAEYCAIYRDRYLLQPEGNLAQGRPVTYTIAPKAGYTELARTALTDGLYGGTTYVESWVGWEGTDGDFTIDLGSEQKIRSISTEFLLQLGAWILLPGAVEYFVSSDGKEFKSVASVKIPEDRRLRVDFVPVKAEVDESCRYVRVKVTGTKTCPPWHYGVGNPSWFFIDEVTVF